MLGGGNSAGQAVLHLARYAAHVRLVVRSGSLAKGMSQYLVGEIEQNPVVTVHTGSEVSGGGGDGWLDHVLLRNLSTGAEERVAADALFVMIGAEPRTDWLPDEVWREKGFVVCGTDAMGRGRWPLERMPMPYETTLPGFFAVGDVREGSVKRVASAVGEGSVVVSQLHQYLAESRAAVDAARGAGA